MGGPVRMKRREGKMKEGQLKRERSIDRDDKREKGGGGKGRCYELGHSVGFENYRKKSRRGGEKRETRLSEMVRR